MPKYPLMFADVLLLQSSADWGVNGRFYSPLPCPRSVFLVAF